MLMKIGEVQGLTDEERFEAAIIRDWVALDPESGAFLGRSWGRTGRGDVKYHLIIPNRSPEERGGLLAAYGWDYPEGRKFMRAYSLNEAILLANKKLEKVLQNRLKKSIQDQQ